MLPTLTGLVRQASNQVNIDIRNPGRTKPGNIVQHDISLVQTPNRRCLVIHKGLHAQADAIDSAAVENFHSRLRKRAGRALHRYLGIRLHVEILPNSDKDTLQLCYIQDSWSASAEINGVNCAI